MSRIDNFRSLKGILIAVSLTSTVAAAAFFGYEWCRQIAVERVTVIGNTFATSEEVRRLAEVDTAGFLFDLDPALISDRIQRHPWVREARAQRLLTGTLKVRVRERTPVLLGLDGEGRPSFYVDSEGHPMPLADRAYFNVPLLRGIKKMPHPLRPIDNDHVVRLATALAAIGVAERALLSEFEVRGREIWLRTAASSRGQSINVRLGEGSYEEKMRRLHAFWHQAVQTQPNVRFDLVDLRFDSQIVTREHSGDRTQIEKIN